MSLRIVGDGELYRAEHRHDPLCGLVEVLPETVLQKGEFHGGGCLAHAVAFGEVADSAGGIAAAAQAAEGGHTGIVPAGDLALLHQLPQLPLGHDRVVDAQPGKLDLPGMRGHRAVGDDPVVERAMILKLQGTEGVGDALQRVLQGVGKVIHGVDAPFVAQAVVVLMVDAVEHRVPHVEVATAQVDFGPQGYICRWGTPRPSSGRRGPALLHRPVPPGRAGRGVHIAPIFPELLRSQGADVGQPLFDELHGILVHLLKVVGGIEEAIPPVIAQPVDVLLDGLHVLHIFLGGIGVVHAEVAQATVFFSGAEVDKDGLGMPDVEVAVGFGREAGVDGHTLELPALCDILVDKIMDEVLRHYRGFGGAGGLVFLGHVSSLLYFHASHYFTL